MENDVSYQQISKPTALCLLTIQHKSLFIRFTNRCQHNSFPVLSSAFLLLSLKCCLCSSLNEGSKFQFSFSFLCFLQFLMFTQTTLKSPHRYCKEPDLFQSFSLSKFIRTAFYISLVMGDRDVFQCLVLFLFQTQLWPQIYCD